MRRSLISVLALFLALFMLATTLVACTTGSNNSNETDSTSGSTGGEKDSESVGNNESDTESSGSGDNGDNVGPNPSIGDVGPFGASIEYANQITNGVQTYYTDAARNTYTITNLDMNLEYNLKSTSSVLVNHIKNKNGGTYVQNTMDSFLKLTDGTVIYSSSTAKDARSNVYRLGYYYYDVHFLDHSFLGDYKINATEDFDVATFSQSSKGIRNLRYSNGEGRALISGSDPYVYMPGGENVFTFSADEYNALQISIKSESANAAAIYYISGDATGHTDNRCVKFNLINDGEYHTYTIILSEGADYNGTISRLRLDFEGGSINDIIYFKDTKLLNAVTAGPSLYLDRVFHTYSDKLHHELHFVATKTVDNVAELGMVTNVAVDTVDKLIVKDANGTHTSLDGVDWATAEYVGFDIKGVGIFGYILPVHKNTGTMKVEKVDGNYVITQSVAPGVIFPAVEDTSNDFCMGQRIYTDTNHTFDAFIIEAEMERNPLTTLKSESYLGYDALSGAYEFTISGSGFNPPFLYEWNKHHTVDAMMRGGDTDRRLYVRTITTAGCLENAVLLGEGDMVLPIQLEASKNFGSEDEEPIFYTGDKSYGETVFPLYLTAGDKLEFKVLNLYQNWGKFPLKQLSSIQYFWPYYHLSVGTTETSCISPWYGARDLWTLPDFRSQSMPYWWDLPEDGGYSNQPQHTHGGYQYFLQYTDADGKYNATENISNVIDSSGPVYAEVDMTYISDDGKIKVVYKHLEMPQMDELRAYYEISYEILEEVTIKDFAKDFSIYSFEGYAGYYRNMGYWAENGDNDGVVHKETNGASEPEMLVLGNDSPYVALYNLYSSDANWANNNVNLGFTIYNSDIVIGGEKIDDNFVVIGEEYVYSLSLDLGQVTLKPGDKIDINMIISPWGWYDSTDDTNMQKIRENTCIDPLTVEVTDGKKIDSPFLPRIKSTNGKSAEFTLSGGTSNVAVRVYGFEKLTAPKIYELVDGNWVEYVVSSIDSPDAIGNIHYYDGYFVYNDNDGTYSYSFAVNMDDVESRTFKVVAEEDFKSWPSIPDNSAPVGPLDVYVGTDDLFIFSGSAHGINNREVISDEVSFLRIFGNGSAGEAYFTVVSNNDKTITPTGQYAVIKYRFPAAMSVKSNIQIFASTNQKNATGRDDFTTISSSALYYDEQWHIIVIDLSKEIGDYKADENGEYTALHMRVDVFNDITPNTDYIDIAYVALTDDLDDLCEFEGRDGSADVISSSKISGELDLSSGTITESSGSGSGSQPTEKPTSFIDPNNAQGYVQSSTSYVSGIDFINGFGDEDPNGPAYDNYRSHQNIGPKIVNLDSGTIGNAYLVLSGWTMVYEGIEKFVWSADGGKTWHDAEVYGRESLAAATGGIKNAGDAHFSVTVDGFNKETYNQDYYAGSAYQSTHKNPSGVAAHLTDYIGKEVSVTFAVVPKNDPDGLCLIGHITNVRVYESDDAANVGEACKHDRPFGYKFVDDGDSTTDNAMIIKTCKCGEVTFETSAPSYVFFFGNIGGVDVAPLVYENAKGYVKNSATGFTVSNNNKSFTADANGVLNISGWMGMNGGISEVVFKVYDANGNELTSGWTNTNATISNRGDLNAEMTKRDIETMYGKGYSISINLSEYFAISDNLTIKLGVVAAGAPADSNDKYVHMGEFTDVYKGK